MNNTSPKKTPTAPPQTTHTSLQRSLSNRHIQLIAIGGAIGTGLFMGSGKTIHLAGPSIIFVYIIIGSILFFVMRVMGELLLSNLNYRSFTDFASDLLGPQAGFFTGWTYWFCWIVTGTADIIAIVSYIHHWWPDMPGWIPAFGMVFLLLSLNLLSVRLFGELEFWFSMIKIVAICALIFVGLAFALSSYTSPKTGVTAAFSNLWKFGGMFPQKLEGFYAGFQIAIFAFVGIELVGTTAAETKDPETTLPKAINSIPLRIIIFYVFALIAIMIVTPWYMVLPDRSPFTEMFMLTGLPAAAGVINFVVLTSAASSANGGVYSTSRMLYGLAKSGVAPKRFGVLSKNATPASGLIFSCICLLSASALIFVIPNLMDAFTIVTSVAALLFMFIWSIILISYLVFIYKRPQKHERSIFKMPGSTFMPYVCLIFFAFMVYLLLCEDDTRKAVIVTPIWFFILALAYRQIPKKNQNKNPQL